jgi:hypothetical protein
MRESITRCCGRHLRRRFSTSIGPEACARHAIPHEIEADPVAHLPRVNAYAATLDLGGLIHACVPTEMDVDAGTLVRGLVWDTRRGRSPLSRVEAVFAHHDTA